MHVTTAHHATSDQGSGGSIQLTVSYDEAGLTLTPTPFGLLVALESCAPSDNPGAPALPRQMLRVAMPYETHCAGITVTAVRTVQVTTAPTLVAPVQRAQPGLMGHQSAGQTGDGGDGRGRGDDARSGPKPSTRRPADKPAVEHFRAPDVVPPDVARYQQEISTPRPLARLRATEYIGPVQIASVEINPLRFAETGLLEFHPLIEVTLAYQADHSDGGTGTQAGVPGDTSDTGKWTAPNRQAISSRTQAERLYQLATLMVVNPQDVYNFGHVYPHLPQHVDYLIVTDNQRWDETTITPTGSAGDLVSAFQPLIAWKSSRGLSARIVTVTDIVNGVYGNFRMGARDLPEVIRKFLQWALTDWGIAWVLLGGTVDIIPTRHVAGATEGGMGVQATDPPPSNTSFWTGSFLKMHVDSPGVWWPGPSLDVKLVRPDTGALIPYDAAGTSSASSPGWYFATDDTYSARSTTPTRYVVVNGPPTLVNADLQWLYFWNTLATDLYYASLTGPQYGLPGQHDWDLNGNGIYGQHTGDTDLDGVSYNTDVSVGRAPADSPQTATTFVTKVIAYEKFQAPNGTPLDAWWPRRMVLESTNWGGRIGCWPTSDNPPDDNTYHHGDTDPYTLIKLQDAPTDLQWRLFAFVTDTDIRLMPDDVNASPSVRGWYYAVSATDRSASVLSFTLIIGGMPHHFTMTMPTQWVVVYSGSPDELAPQYYVFDRMEQDDSEHDQEQLRMQVQADMPGIAIADRLYEDEIDLTPAETTAAPVEHIAGSRVQAALNAGPHFVSLSGHGSPDGCCWVSRDLADGLTNGPYMFIGYADSCLTNQFDAGPFGSSCSEHLINNPNGGAVAYVGSTRFSWIGVGDDFQRAFFHQMTATHQLGLVFDVLRTMVMAPTGFWRGYNRWSIFALNLMGDPEMPIWMPVAPILRIRVPELVNPYVPIEVIVTQPAGDPGGPVEDATVYVRQGAYSEVAQTDARGVATLTLAGATAGPLEVVASQFGAIPALQVLQVTTQRHAGANRRTLFPFLLVLLALTLVVLVLVALLILRG